MLTRAEAALLCAPRVWRGKLVVHRQLAVPEVRPFPDLTGNALQGVVVFSKNGSEQGRARGLRGRLYPFVSMNNAQDAVKLLGEDA